MSNSQKPDTNAGTSVDTNTNIDTGSNLLPLPVNRTQPASAQERWPDIVWRRLTDLVPLLLALVLALVTTWLVKSMPQEENNTPKPPANQPDYYLRNFELRRYTPTGTLHSALTGIYADHTPDQDRLRIQQPGSYAIDAQGNETHTTANRSVSDHRGQNVEMFDQVRVVHQRVADAKQTRPEPIVFESNYLKTVNRQEHISTNQPVKITRGANVITGSGMDFFNSTKVVQIHGRAHATIAPTATTRQ